MNYDRNSFLVYAPGAFYKFKFQYSSTKKIVNNIEFWKVAFNSQNVILINCAILYPFLSK
jgi:hypothetical protein